MDQEQKLSTPPESMAQPNMSQIKDSSDHAVFHRLTKSAGVVAFFTMLSRFSGLARDMVTFHFFGANAVTDAFFVAFTIPNMMRRFVAEGALTVAFIPVYSEVRRSEGEKTALQFYAAVLGLLLVTLVLLVFVSVIFASYLVYAFASGFAAHPEQMQIAVWLTRFMFPYVFFISLVALCMGVLNSHQHFAVPAASPVLLNVAMVGCTYWLFSYFQEPIWALAIGVVLGGVLQLLVQIPALYRYGLLVWPSFQWNTGPVKKLIRVMFPALFGIAVYQLNLIILRQIGSYLPEGQISYYYNADRLMQLALGIFSISIATAALPMMSEQTAVGDKTGLMRTWLFSTKLTNFITIPAAWGLALIGVPVVSTLYLHGQYHWADVQMTAYAVMAFAPGLISIAISRTTTQVFYALEDLRTSVIAGALTVVVNLVLGIFLLRFEVVGLALSLTISSWFQTIILVIWLKIRMGKLGIRTLFSSMMKQTLLAALSSLAALLICLRGDWSLGPTLSNIAILFAAIMSAILLYGFGAILLKYEEAILVKNIFYSRIKKFF